MATDNIRPQDFSPYLFWDTDIAALDLDKHAAYIIDRVLHLGTIDDFRLLLSCFGADKIKEVVKELRYLDNKVLHFVSIYFNIPLPDFRCYLQKPLIQSHWQY